MTDDGYRFSETAWRSQFSALSNWGRWGPSDQRGTLNLLTEDVVAAAGRLIRSGRRVSCSRRVEFSYTVNAYEAFRSPLRLMTATGAQQDKDGSGYASDWLGFDVHSLYMTHLDAPSHQFWNGMIFNGHPAAEITTNGAAVGSVELAQPGIVSRGILLDVPRALGVAHLAPGHAISAGELDAAAARVGVDPHAGDIVLVRTGYGRVREQQTGRLPQMPLKQGVTDASAAPHLPGLAPETAAWFRERDIAVVGTDTGTEARPSVSANPRHSVFHLVAMCAIGMWILDNGDYEALAQTCEDLKRWEFFFAITPLRLEASTGSPVSPIAIF
jgi:kynurenine formamidase